MTNILPEKVQWREDKGNLAPNFENGLLTFERERLDDIILASPETIEPFVDRTALREAYGRYVQQGGGDAITVWLAVTLAVWLRYAGMTSQPTEGMEVM
jgi:asparagine synthase (glutamine-hydrolysing)